MSRAQTKGRGIYHLRWRNVIQGPLTLEDVLRLLRENRITPDHEISTDGRSWQSITKSGLLGIGKPIERRPDAEFTSRAVSKTPSSLPSSGVDNKYSATPPEISHESENNWRRAKNQWRISAVIIVGTLPLAISQVQSAMGLPFAHVAWLFSFYFCGLWAWVAGLLITWRAEVWRRALACGVFTCFVGMVMLYAWHNIPIIASLYDGIENGGELTSLLGFILGVGLMEELCKSIPLILFCMGPKQIMSPNDGLFYGLLSGLGFATREGVDYTIKYWTQAVGLGAAGINQAVEDAVGVYGTLNREAFEARLYDILPQIFEIYGEIVTVQLVRFMTLPLLHAAWAGLVGYSFALAVKGRNWMFFVGGIGVAAILHGSYNYFSNGIYGLVIVAVTLMIPILLVQYTKKMKFA